MKHAAVRELDATEKIFFRMNLKFLRLAKRTRLVAMLIEVRASLALRGHSTTGEKKGGWALRIAEMI